MKTKLVSVDIIQQTILDSYKNKVTLDTIFEIKEKSKGHFQGIFVARILKSKEVDFYFKYFINGKPKLIKIGRLGKIPGRLSLSQARTEFLKLSASYNLGTDPKVQKLEDAQKLAREKNALEEIERKKQLQGNLRQLSEFFLDHLEKNSGETHYRNARNAFKKNLSIISLDTKASDITKDQIILILHAIASRGSTIMANRMRSYLSSMFQYGIHFDDSTESVTRQTKFYIQFNPVTAVQPIEKKENIGERSLSKDEVKIFWRSLEASGMSILRINALKLILLSGSRVKEMAGLRWNEIDSTDKIISLPAKRTKNKLPHIIPINKIMLDIIESTPKLNDTYLFPANNDEPMKVDGFSQAIARLVKKIQITPFTPRDLRRTFKTLTGAAGISKEIRDRLQNHALDDVSSKHYDKYNYLKEKREAMDKWNEYFMSILNNG